uniref:aminotransferase-like domain-containing protein n=1 Tax=Pedobacter schmidteae TaxID=2201271 RepID=UPI000EABE260|nr:PLP-dependent aminotransferase family protein [Pedobacter schmidteae]
MKLYKFEVFTSAIEKNIREGVYKAGQKLPTVRELKKQYQLSSSTIQSGYEYLVILGLVESIPKSGYYVITPRRIIAKNNEPKRLPAVRDAVFEHNLVSTTTSRKGKRNSEFNVAAPGDLLIPQKLLLRTMQQVIREQGAGLLRYYPLNGLATLRTNIITRAAGYHTRLNFDELMITDGALQALYIALATVCASGDVIAVESPCVFSILHVVSMLNLMVIEVPVDPGVGFDVDFFSNACLKNKVKAVLVTPNYHNPTGILLSDENKKALLRIAQQHDIAVIENDIYGDLSFSGHRPSTIKSFDDSGLVMTYSSYAKTLAPGIRLGWLSAGRFISRAEQIRFSLGSTVSPIYQETVSRLLSSSSYDRHIRSFRIQLAKNAQFTINLLSENFPKRTSILNPSGGYHIWVKMPDDTNMDQFYLQCEQIGVRFTPGYTFSFSNSFNKYFRVVFADAYSPKRIEAIKLAGQQLG